MGIESLKPNFEGTKSSGDMNAFVPPSNCALQDIGLMGSRIMVMKPKSARQARGGVPLDMRMFGCWMSKGNYCELKGTDTFEVPMRETSTMKILETLSCVV